MKTPNPTVANSDLWAHYLRQQWSRWLDPLGGAGATESFAAGISTLYTLALGDFIARLFTDNASYVNTFLEERPEQISAAAAEEPDDESPCAAKGDAPEAAVPSWMSERTNEPAPAYAPAFYERATA